MNVGNVNAVNAYKIAQKMLDSSAAATAPTQTGGSFGDLVSQAASRSIGNIRNAENVAAQGVAGSASINEVVSAVNSADMALKTIVAIRDRVMSAYQDIIKMPI